MYQAQERAKAAERMDRMKMTSITTMLDLFELPKDGKKEDKIARVVAYLEKPKDMGKKNLAAIVGAWGGDVAETLVRTEA